MQPSVVYLRNPFWFELQTDLSPKRKPLPIYPLDEIKISLFPEELHENKKVPLFAHFQLRMLKTDTFIQMIYSYPQAP